MKVFTSLCMTVLGWSSAFIAIRISIVSYSPIATTFLRYSVASTGCLFIYLLSKKVKVKSSDRFKAHLTGFVGMGMYSFFLTIGEQTVPASIAGFVVSLMPLVAAICAAFIFNEKMTTRLKIGFIFSLFGVFLIAYRSMFSLSSIQGLAWVFASMFCGVAFTLLQRPIVKKIPPVQFLCYSIWGGVSFLFLLLVIFRVNLIQEFQLASSKSTLSILYLGLVPSILAYFGWAYALSKINIAKAGIAMYGMPIVTAILSWLILSERSSGLELLGMLIALFGCVLGSVKLPLKKAHQVAQGGIEDRMASGLPSD